MSLIEATELAAENARTTQVEPSLTNSPLVKLSSSILDVEQDEQEKIKTGTSLAIDFLLCVGSLGFVLFLFSLEPNID